MKFACLDKTAADRLKLQEKVEQVYESGRASVGHLALARIYPCSKEELLLNSAPDAVLIGAGFALEELAAVCRDIQSAHPDTPLLIFISHVDYSLRNLRRFEKYSRDIFDTDEPSVRLLYTLSHLQDRSKRLARGKLVTVNGVKGGVGATSVVTGLAHAAEALGQSSVIIDLSNAGAIAHYMGLSRWHSPELATALTDGLPADDLLLERCLGTAPNGINLFLPPSGGSDIRELWLRDPACLEFMLSCVDLLKERFDLVLVDVANAEGVFPFALQARAQSRLLLTSNDPAAVHLLSRRLLDMSNIPGEASTYILANMLTPRGLSHEDILDFLVLNKSYNDEMSRLRPLSYDPQGKGWIGTGNTFYTESRRSSQLVLELCLRKLIQPDFRVELESAADSCRRFSISGLLKYLTLRPSQQPALPYFETASVPSSANQHGRPEQFGPRSILATQTSAPEKMAEEPRHEETPRVISDRLSNSLYQPPKLVVNSA